MPVIFVAQLLAFVKVTSKDESTVGETAAVNVGGVVPAGAVIEIVPNPTFPEILLV